MRRLSWSWLGKPAVRRFAELLGQPFPKGKNVQQDTTQAEAASAGEGIGKRDAVDQE